MKPPSPFWNTTSHELSQKIWHPDQLETVDKSTRYWNCKENEYLSNQTLNVVPLPRNEEMTIVTRKIRFRPTKQQALFFNKCFTAHRFYYNKTVQEINRRYAARKAEFESSPTCIHCKQPKEADSWSCTKHKNEKVKWNLSVRKESIQPVVMLKNNELPKNEQKYEIVPVDTRSYAVRQACSSYSSAAANKINGNIHHFELKYIKRSNRQIFWIDHRAIKIKNGEVRLFPRALGENCVLRVKNFPEENSSAVKILRDRGVYYLVLSVPYEGNPSNNKLTTIALDPGVRTFQTGYSPNGQVFKFGENQIDNVKQLHDKIDLLKSIRSNSKGRTRNNLRKKILKLEFKISGIINDLHNQTGSMLAKNYRDIYLPVFATSGMQQSEIHSTVKRRMNSLAHYRFQQKLLYFGKKYGSNVHLVDESFTTKTCGGCGAMNEKIGSSKHFVCQHCSYSLNRDIHGARNIWIRTATECSN